MKYINKIKTGKGYKELLIIHKKNGSYNDTANNISKNIFTRDNILKDLLLEQGYLCAYCNQSISLKNSSIEHIIGQKEKDDEGNKIGLVKDTDYDNMLAVCNGSLCTKLNCDKSRANYQKDSKRKLFISPLNKINMKNIRFSESGEIYYKHFIPKEDIQNKNDYLNEGLDDNIRYDLNFVLNLNCNHLKEERVKTRKAVMAILIKYKFNKKIVNNQLEFFNSLSNGKYRKFSQVAIYELEKHK